MTHDENEREAQIRDLLPLVKRIARRVRRLVPSVEIDDLVGDGSLGLIRAVDHFDQTRGPSLEQYARQLIVGSMLNGIRRMDPVSERVRRTIREGEGARYRIAAERGAIPSPLEMERIHPGYARATIAAHRGQPLSLDAPLPEGEQLSGDWSGDPAAIVGERDAVQRMRAVVESLPERQRHLMAQHYYGERSLREIGKRMKISPQRASQLHLAAVARMRKAAHALAG